jgi:hypothetical protein
MSMNEKMNKDWVLFHLKESKDAIEGIIAEIESDPEYEYGNYVVGMGHLYHHVNTAWNARNATKEQVNTGAPTDFKKWSQFPSDLPEIFTGMI